jgi:Mrp family chromosome partitioning ATPase
MSAIEEFAHNLHQVGVAGSQMAFFGAAADLDTGAVAIRFARALARDARVVLVGFGSGDAAIRDISSDPNAPGLAELAAGSASFGDIITKDRASGVNLIASARDGAMRNGLMSVPGMSKNFDALAYSYAHVVIDAGGLRGRNMEAVARIAPHAILLVDTTSSVAATKARDSLMDVGFNNVTLLVAGHADSEGPAASRFSAAAA